MYVKAEYEKEKQIRLADSLLKRMKMVYCRRRKIKRGKLLPAHERWRKGGITQWRENGDDKHGDTGVETEKERKNKRRNE